MKTNYSLLIASLIVVIFIVCVGFNSEGYLNYGANRYAPNYNSELKNTTEARMLTQSYVAQQMKDKEYSLDSVSLNGKTLGYIRIRPRTTDIMIHLRVPNRGDYKFLMSPTWMSNQEIENTGVDKELKTDKEDIHLEKEAFSRTESMACSTAPSNSNGGQSGFYPHAAGYSMRTTLHSNTSIPSASHQELLTSSINIEGPSLALEGFDFARGGQGVMMITTASDGKLHLYSTILSKILLDIERKKMPHYHFILNEI
jgi:hypothetical protein